MTAKKVKKRGPLRREADYAAIALTVDQMAEVRRVVKALCHRIDWIENNLQQQRLHTTQDVADVLTCQEFVRKG